MLSEIRTGDLTDADHARLAFLRASNMLWALADPARAKELIDDASRTTPPQARSYIDAFLTVYWFAMDQPDAAMEASKQLALDELPEVVGAEIAWVRAAIFADAGRTNEAVAVSRSGLHGCDSFFRRSADEVQHRRRTCQRIVAVGSGTDALDVAERVRQRQPTSRGRLNYSALPWQVGPPLVPLTSIPHACCWNRQQSVCLPRATPSAGAIATTSHASPCSPCVVQPTRQPPRLPRSTSCNVAFGRWTTSAAWRGRGWTRARAPSVRRLPSCCRRPKGLQLVGNSRRRCLCLQTATQFGDRSSAPRLRELESIVEGPRVGLAARFAEALRDGDAAELASVSEDFERMGDLVAAVDAAALAALAYRRQDLRGSALGCSTRAEALAEQCGGAHTPALRQASEPLAANRSRRRDRDADRRGIVQPRSCRTTDCFHTHRRKPHLPGHVEDRDHQPRRARRAAAAPQGGDRVNIGF